MIGQVLDRYRIESKLGEGGMGVVYKARDTELGRAVAIKVLPPGIVNDAAARERFVREGRAIASLNHPHICALYDVGEAHNPTADHPMFLVMEYLEGETLSHRLTRGRLPMAQAVQVAVQIASALDKAHRTGIVHRDLKPGNVFLLRKDASAAATAKLLDFGLAKAVKGEIEGGPHGQTTVMDLTTPGTLLGTVQYMAPEQVEGREADARTDIFALGVVLYEMLTGTKPFSGESRAGITAAILTHEPDPVSAHLPSTPRTLDRIVRKCLAKDPDERWQSAADLKSELEWSAQVGTEPETPPAAEGRRMRVAVWALAAAVAIAAIVIVAIVLRGPSEAPAPLLPKQFVVALPDALQSHVGNRFALLPDGSGYVYAGEGETRKGTRWTLRTFTDGLTRLLPQTEGAFGPFFSPDGKWLAFFQGNQLRRVAVGGGPVLDICETVAGNGASRGDRDQIVFSRPGGLWSVDASGGEPQRLTTVAAGEMEHRNPVILPGSKAVIFTIRSNTGAIADAAIATVPMQGGQPQLVVKGAASARYSPTGHLLFIRGSDLVVATFDPDRLQLTGDPILAVGSVQTTAELWGQYDLAGDGTLVYSPAGGELARTLVWADRQNALHPLAAPPQPYAHLAMSPDGRAMIVEVEATPHNLWRYDFQSGAFTQLTREGSNHRAALSPDGRFMAFSSDRTVPRSLFRQATDGSGSAEPLLDAPHALNVSSWSRDGRWIAFTESHPQSKSDIWVLPMEGDRKPRRFLVTASDEHSAVFSPDGQWMAFVSNESGREQTFVTAFPGAGPRKQVSLDGGEAPTFSDDGRTLYFRSRNRVMSADVVTSPVLTIGAPRAAFEIPDAQRITAMPFPVSQTGDRVLYVREADGRPALHVIVNWFETLRGTTAAK